jgi:hypothetical protein
VSSTSGPGENADAYAADRPSRPSGADAYPGGIVVPPPPDFGRPEDTARPDAVVPPDPGPVLDSARPDEAVWPPDERRPAPADDDAPFGAPPDRRTRPLVISAVGIGAAILLAVPLLLAGAHQGKQHRSASAADSGPSDQAQPPLPPPSFPGSPTPVATPSASPHETKPTATPTLVEKAAARKQTTAALSKDGFRGAVNVLMRNAKGGLCADVPGYGNGYVGLFLQTGYCTYGNSDNQVWSLAAIEGLRGPGGSTLFVIRNTMDELCIDLPGKGAKAAGTDVGEQNCHPTSKDNELWYRTHVSGDLYRIRNYASHGLCFGVAGHSAAVEKRLEIHTCGSADSWSLPSGK